MYFSSRATTIKIERTKQTTVMIEPSTRRNAAHIAIDLDMNFSGFTRGVLKAILFLIGNRNLSQTQQTKIVTLCNDPTQAPLVMLHLVKQRYREQYPELTHHFDAIIETIQNSEGALKKDQEEVTF